MNYYKTKTLTTSSSELEIFSAKKAYIKVRWWELLEPGDKIIYLQYMLQSGNQAVHQVLSVKDDGVEALNGSGIGHFLRHGDLEGFSTLEYAQKEHPEEFI